MRWLLANVMVMSLALLAVVSAEACDRCAKGSPAGGQVGLPPGVPTGPGVLPPGAPGMVPMPVMPSPAATIGQPGREVRCPCPQGTCCGSQMGGCSNCANCPGCPGCPGQNAALRASRYWSASHGCYLYYDPATRASYYWSEPQRGFLPVPTQHLAPMAAPTPGNAARYYTPDPSSRISYQGSRLR